MLLVVSAAATDTDGVVPCFENFVFVRSFRFAAGVGVVVASIEKLF